MAIDPAAQTAKAIAKALDTASFDADFFAYSFTQGAYGADPAIQLRMADAIMALSNVWAGWHASGYAKGTPLAGVCEQAYYARINAGMEI